MVVGRRETGGNSPPTAHPLPQQLLPEVILRGWILGTEVEVTLTSDGLVHILTVPADVHLSSQLTCIYSVSSRYVPPCTPRAAIGPKRLRRSKWPG